MYNKVRRRYLVCRLVVVVMDRQTLFPRVGGRLESLASCVNDCVCDEVSRENERGYGSIPLVGFGDRAVEGRQVGRYPAPADDGH